eukprot:Rmarinus@m.17392
MVRVEGLDADDRSDSSQSSSSTSFGEHTWRGSGPHNFSDWTLNIDGEVYNVHRFIVGCGPRCSLVLRQLMLTEPLEPLQKKELRKSLSLMRSTYKLPSMPRECVELVPAVLDYMYTGDILFTVETAVPMLLLSTVLDIPCLIVRLQKFICENTNANHCLSLLLSVFSYFDAAKSLLIDEKWEPFERNLALGYSTVARHFNQFTSEELVQLPLVAFRSVICHTVIDAEPKKLCNVVAYYIRMCKRTHGTDLSREDFVALTEMITEITVEEAMFLLVKAFDFEHGKFADRCLSKVAANFDAVTMEDAAGLPVAALCALLERDDLKVAKEDSVFALLVNYTARNEGAMSKRDATALWGCCRFSYLSLPNLKVSHVSTSIPSRMVSEGLLLRNLRQGNPAQYDEYLASLTEGSLSRKRALPRVSYRRLEAVQFMATKRKQQMDRSRRDSDITAAALTSNYPSWSDSGPGSPVSPAQSPTPSPAASLVASVTSSVPLQMS